MILTPLYGPELVTRGLREDPRVLGGDLAHSESVNGELVNTHSAQFTHAGTNTNNLAEILGLVGGEGINTTGDRTYETLFELDTFTGAATQTLMSRWGFVAATQNDALLITSSGPDRVFHAFVRTDTGGFQQQRWTWVGGANNVWTHVAWTWLAAAASQAVQHELFIDGVSQGNGTIIIARAGSSTVSGDRFSIGGSSTLSGAVASIDGRQDESRVWSTIRTQPQIDANKLAHITAQPGLEAYHQLNNVWLDASGNGWTLTPTAGGGGAPALPTFSTDVAFV